MAQDFPALCQLSHTPSKPENKGYRHVQAIVDSGAADHVMANDLLPDYIAGENEAMRQGVTYLTADGGEIPNQGEKSVRYKTTEGHEVMSCFQVADVRKPLLSVPSLTAAGHDVVFHKRGGTITHPKGDRKMHFRRQGGVYILDMWAPPFQRQG